MHLADFNVARLRAPIDDPVIDGFRENLQRINGLAGVEALHDFTYRSAHRDFLRRREWFDAPTGAILALWWIPAGTVPTVEDGVERLAHLRAHGPTPLAFDFRTRFAPESGPAVA